MRYKKNFSTDLHQKNTQNFKKKNVDIDYSEDKKILKEIMA